MPRYFIDTEFIDEGETIELLSIAIVCEDGREFYSEVQEPDLSNINSFVEENVLPNLWHKQVDKSEFNAWSRDGGAGGLLKRDEIAREIKRFCAPRTYGTPEFWGYYCDYDWVAFCQLFGLMVELPDGYPMYCLDINQLIVLDGLEIKQDNSNHNALDDARWIAKTYGLIELASGKEGKETNVVECSRRTGG